MNLDKWQIGLTEMLYSIQSLRMVEIISDFMDLIYFAPKK